MRISLDDIRNIARNFLEVLSREGIQSNGDLEKRIGETFSLSSEDFVTIVLRPSDLGTSAYSVSYIRHGTGIPVELRINEKLDYSRVCIKLQERIDGYLPFGSDIFGNIAQDKEIKSSDFSLVIQELRILGN